MRLRNKRQCGFTLVEIMIVVAVIGLLAAIALPNFVKARQVSQTTRMYADMKTAGTAFEVYAVENGDYPANAAPGEIPPGMAPYLGRFPWTRKTVLEGTWNWDYDRYGFRAGISIINHEASSTIMAELDRRVDDGNSGTGQLRQRPNGHTYVLE